MERYEPARFGMLRHPDGAWVEHDAAASELVRLRARVEELEETRNIRRESLAQEIRGFLKSRGYFCGGSNDSDSDVIVRLGSAFEAAERRVAELERVVNFAIAQGAHGNLCAARYGSVSCDCWKRTVSGDLAALDAAREGE